MKGKISPRMFPNNEEPETCRDDALTGDGMTMVIFYRGVRRSSERPKEGDLTAIPL
jgi:hypothetical protein